MFRQALFTPFLYQKQQLTMVKEKPHEAPPPTPLADRKRSPDSSLTQTVISSTDSFKTENRNLSLMRLEFTTRNKGVDVSKDVPLPKLAKKLLSHLFDTDPTLEIYPVTAWPTHAVHHCLIHGQTSTQNKPHRKQTTPKKRPPSPLPTRHRPYWFRQVLPVYPP
jgi:hypothetical protein